MLFLFFQSSGPLLGPADLGRMWCLQFTTVFTQMLERRSKQTTLAVALAPL